MAISLNIDNEWKNFISSSYNNDDALSDEEFDINEVLSSSSEELISANLLNDFENEPPKATNIYISTKTKIAYLNTHIDLKELFWQIPIIPYEKQCDCVIKKQMKFNSIFLE